MRETEGSRSLVGPVRVWCGSSGFTKTEAGMASCQATNGSLVFHFNNLKSSVSDFPLIKKTFNVVAIIYIYIYYNRCSEPVVTSISDCQKSSKWMTKITTWPKNGKNVLNSSHIFSSQTLELLLVQNGFKNYFNGCIQRTVSCCGRTRVMSFKCNLSFKLCIFVNLNSWATFDLKMYISIN